MFDAEAFLTVIVSGAPWNNEKMGYDGCVRCLKFKV